MLTLSSKLMSVKLLVIDVIDFKHYPRTNCLVQGSFILATFKIRKKYLNIRITTI